MHARSVFLGVYLTLGSFWAAGQPCPCPGDIDCDCQVGLGDVAIMLSTFGLDSGHPSFDARTDFDGSGETDLDDLAFLLSRFGESCTGCTGACCLPSGQCQVLTSDECQAAGGQYRGPDTTCAEDSCTGACCLPTGDCQTLSESDCAVEGGIFQGFGASCSDGGCVGACCLDGGICVVVSESACAADGGSYRGNGTTCDTNPCDGACCTSAGVCTVTDEKSCTAGGGTFIGYGTDCDPNPCLGACCFAGVCLEVSEDDCALGGGCFKGIGTTCDPNPCPECPAFVAPPDPFGGSDHQASRLDDIVDQNVVLGAGIFPEVPTDHLRRDGVTNAPANLAAARRGLDALPGWDLRARVYYPATAAGVNEPVAAGGPFPVVLLAHGVHNSARLPLPPGSTIVITDENYRGYDYFQRDLARRGFISISIDLDDVLFADLGQLSRAWVILCHLRNLERLNGLAGHRLENQVDLTRVVLVGHSRGGEAVVQAARMNADGSGPYAADRFTIRGVISIAATRFLDGTRNFDPDAVPLTPSPETLLNIPTALVPYLGIYGDADGDVSGAPLADCPVTIYDRSAPDPKQFVYIYGANHNFWNTSWFDLARAAGVRGDDGEFDDGTGAIVNCVTNRITATQQQDLLRAYGLAFIRGYLGGDATAVGLRRYFRGPANQVPPVAIAATTCHIQFQNPPDEREIVDSFEEDPSDRDATSRGEALDRTTLPAATFTEVSLSGGIAAGATQSWFHATKGALFEWDAATDFYQLDTPGRSVDARGYEYISFRVAMDRRGPGAGTDLDIRVTLTDGAESATVRTSATTTIPVAQTRADRAVLTKSMLKTIRIPICRFLEDNCNLDIADLESVRFTFFDRAAGKIGLDDVEFSN